MFKELNVFLFFFLFSPLLKAKIQTLAPGLTVDTGKFTQKLASCDPQVPGSECIYHCYNINNRPNATYYFCTVHSTALFEEIIHLGGGSILHSGHTLSQKDSRTVYVFPYQTNECVDTWSNRPS